MTRDKSLVQAVELWYPQGEVMAFGAGAYRGNDELRLTRESTSFHQGEGLPGAVWENGKALLWEVSAMFLPAELAARAGVDAAIGYPLFEGGRLFAVMTLLLSQRAETPSCLEIWDVADELDVLKHRARLLRALRRAAALQPLDSVPARHRPARPHLAQRRSAGHAGRAQVERVHSRGAWRRAAV